MPYWEERRMGEAFEELRREMASCTKCGLSGMRNTVVYGAGSEDSDILFVGEAPGFYEDRQGEPFVGAAGKLLNELLASIGLKRSDVYIANVLKCRPPGNRAPLPGEIEACRPYLERQIELIKPRVICTLGNSALQTITGKKMYITKARGEPMKAMGRHIFPLYHPAAALHRGDMREPLFEDFLKLREFLSSAPGPEEPPRQMNLW